jgi:hypothetical protein
LPGSDQSFGRPCDDYIPLKDVKLSASARAVYSAKSVRCNQVTFSMKLIEFSQRVRPNLCGINSQYYSPRRSESMERSYRVHVLGWKYSRRIMFRDGLISFQVTVCDDSCWTCKERVLFVKQQVDYLNAVELTQKNSTLLPVQSFWTYESGSSYITFSPPRKPMSGKRYLSILLGLVLY